MSSYDKYREGDVIRAMFSLTDTPDEYERLYLTSATFKYGVDYFVRALIPIFLRGLGVDCVGKDRQHRDMLHAMRSEVSIDAEGTDFKELLDGLNEET